MRDADPVKKAASVGALDEAREKAAGSARVSSRARLRESGGRGLGLPSKANGGLVGPISRDEINEELLKMISTM